MGTTTKLSTAVSCSKIGTSDEHSVSDLGNKIDVPKQLIVFWNHIQVFSLEISNKNLIKNGFKCFRFWNIVYQKIKYFVLHVENFLVD